MYTEEEMVLAMRNHAVKLQNLCIQQFRRLGIVLREKRTKYLTELKREKEIYGLYLRQFQHFRQMKIFSQLKNFHLEGPLTKPHQMTLNEKKQYDILKALTKYKKIGIGPEALLFKKMLDRRKAVSRFTLLYFLFCLFCIINHSSSLLDYSWSLCSVQELREMCFCGRWRKVRFTSHP